MIEITDADRKAAYEIRVLAAHRSDEGYMTSADTFAEAFAAHREAAVRDMRERAAKEAEDFWGVDSAADRIRALPLCRYP